MFQQLRSELRPIIKLRLAWILADVVDGLFLVGWVAVQYGLGWLIEWLPLTDQFARGIFYVFQFLFAGATVVAPLLHIYKDVRIMYVQIKSEISSAQEDKRALQVVKKV